MNGYLPQERSTTFMYELMSSGEEVEGFWAFFFQFSASNARLVSCFIFSLKDVRLTVRKLNLVLKKSITC